MPPSHHHITSAERSEIAILRRRHYSLREIAAALGRSHSSIVREVRRNSVNGIYQSGKAVVKARTRRMLSKYQGMKVRARMDLQRYIVEKLQRGWTPELIAGRLRTLDMHVGSISAKGIYKWLHSVYGEQYLCYLPGRRNLRAKRKRAVAASWDPGRVGIEKRPQAANDRSEFGHFEGDTVVSGRGYGAVSLAVLVDRKSRFVRIRKVATLRPGEVGEAMAEMLRTVRTVCSLTVDNGVENRRHKQLGKMVGAPVFFCNPYTSWERGSVEQVNHLIRRYIPKGADVGRYSEAQVAHIERTLNHRPRKCLAYRTPYEIMMEHNLLTSYPPSGAIEG